MPAKRSPKLAPATVTAIDSLDSFWRTVDAARDAHGMTALAEKPINGFTAAEYADRYRLNRHTAEAHLRRLEAAGTVTRVLVMLPDSRGHVGPRAVFVPERA